MPSSRPEDWTDGILDAIRRHEEQRSSSPRETAPERDESSNSGKPSSSGESLSERLLDALGRQTDGSGVPAASPSPIKAGDKTRTTSDDLLVGHVALTLKIIDEGCLKECLEDLEKARRAGQEISLEELLIRRGAAKPENIARIRLELSLRSGGISTLSRYETRERLGEGTTAIVFRAWDRDLKRFVALKVLREVAGLSPIARERFRREAEAAAGLTHPNVVTLHDAGETPEGQLYLVLELVEGRSLKEYLSEGQHQDREIAGMIEKTARGVAAAHEKGIVHRDLKPANILVTRGGEPKVGDFGLAHLMDSTAELTRSGTTLGTPLYMSPEQVQGRLKDLTPRTDVYSLGAILYEATVGRPPHLGATVTEIYHKAVQEEPVAPRRVKPDIPRDLETIILKSLDKDPARRYPTAREFAEDVHRYLEGEPIEALSISRPRRLWRKAVKYRAFLFPAVGAVVLGILVGLLLHRRPSTNSVVFFEDATEDFRLIREGKHIIAGKGQTLVAGDAVETGPWPSRGVLRYTDRTLVEIEPDTSLNEIQVEPAKRLFVKTGRVQAEVAKQPKDEPMIFATPQGEAKGSGAKLHLQMDPDPKKGMRLEVEDGEIELKNLAGKSVVVKSGYSAVAAEGVELLTHPRPPLGSSALLDQEWILAFHDEFDGNQLDRSRWNLNSREGGPLYSFVDDAVQQRNGTLSITAERRSLAPGKPYTTGLISMVAGTAQKYGWWEVRARLPKGKAIMPLFRLLPPDGRYPPQITLFGNNSLTGVRSLTHGKGAVHGSGSEVSRDLGDMASLEGFHVFACEWEPSYVKWYVDGNLKGSVKDHLPQVPLCLFASIRVGGEVSPDSSTVFPTALEVDYVRVFRKAGRMPARLGRVVYAEDFENGRGRFKGGEVVDEGFNGSKALALSPRGVSNFGAGWSTPADKSVTISFKVKPLTDVDQVDVLVWSEAQKDNGRYYIRGLKKGEWKEVQFTGDEVRIGVNRDGPIVNTVSNITISFERAPTSSRILLDDFEIKE
jgi:serine/threonine protein kinase/beta-glucanase (GH16 family)